MGKGRWDKRRLALSLGFLGWVLSSTPPLGATCTCTVQAAVTVPTIQVSGTSSGECGTASIDLRINGGSITGRTCGGVASCTHEGSTSSICRTGEQTLTAVCNCGRNAVSSAGNPICQLDTGSASTTVSVESKPSVGISYDGPGADGHGTVSVPFSFPNTAAPTQRSLGVYVDGGLAVGANQADPAGTWTHELNMTCRAQGTHDLQAVARACSSNDAAFRDDAHTTVQVNHQPTVTLTLTPVDATRNQAVVAYDFPQTDAYGERLVTLQTPSGTVVRSTRPAERTGTWIAGLFTCSRPQLVAVGEACGDTKAKSSAVMPGCPAQPPPDDCDHCTDCRANGGGGPAGCSAPLRGAPPSCSPAKSGPGAHLVYKGGGAGGTGLPGSAAWRTALGLYWSHDHAMRIVPSPNASHVWMITEKGGFREYYVLAGGSGLRFYQTYTPGDETRKLYYDTATGGWQLDSLDGRRDYFRADGLWDKTVLAQNPGHPTQATYNAANQLIAVSFPDGRSETYTYGADGKLAAITEVPVAGSGTAPRTWSYTWNGDELTHIGRPDGTAWEFTYDPARNGGRPGYVTQIRLIGSDGVTGRVETAYEYDGFGNVVRAWSGDPLFTGPNAVNRQEFTYDTPEFATRTEVREWLSDTQSEVTVYDFDRDPFSLKARIRSVTGDCPTCGVGPNSQFSYGNASYALFPTQVIDGRGLRTQSAFNVDGQLTSRTEAVGTPQARTTIYTYGNASFSALPTRIDTPSTSGGSALRVTSMLYDAAGNLATRTLQGAEAGSSFTLATLTTFNAAGQPLTMDPPGHGTADQTTYTYDPIRGELLPLSRIDPLIGATTFGYDGFNRRTSVTDPNGVETVTEFDDLDRIVSVLQKGATPAEDLVTTHGYTVFGDLLRTTLPRGNVIEYDYDPAGRLIAIERKPDATTHGERTSYTLDVFGHRVKEELQRWDGASWVTESFTDSVYSSRCQLAKSLHADGSATEYGYDCNGNLEKVWDANHPKATNPNPTQLYAYDFLNRLSSVTQPWTGAGGTDAVTRYTYDVQDHLTGVTDAEGNTTTYTTSDRDLMTREVSPVSGTTTHAYDEHGELVSEIDGRGIATARTVDALDRVTLIDSPDDTLDTNYTYDDPAVPFSNGRLTKIARMGSEIAYGYDRFGNLTRDGELTLGYDANGNRAEIGYPGGVTARLTHDFADREASLEVQAGTATPKSIVSGASYKPFGPLTELTLGNGLAETRAYTNRYFPDRIEVPGRLAQVYTTDRTGNILGFDRTVGADHFPSTFTYQDPQYFLTQGTGPWGQQAWSYL